MISVAFRNDVRVPEVMRGHATSGSPASEVITTHHTHYVIKKTKLIIKKVMTVMNKYK